jgi:hypothetical protein
VNNAAAVENTFERIRRRYAIYFYLPDGMDTGRGMELDLTDPARRRHPDAALQYRQIALAKDGAKPGLITRVPAHPPLGRDPEPVKAESRDTSATSARRRPGVSDSTGPPVMLPIPPAPETSTAEDQARTQTTIRQRRISEPDNRPRVIIGPAQ